MSRRGIGFDASDTESYSEDDATLASMANRTRNSSGRSQATPRTPRRTPAAGRTPRTGAASAQTPRRAPASAQTLRTPPSSRRSDASRSARSLQDSPQPGPSTRRTPPPIIRSAGGTHGRQGHMRKQAMPTKTDREIFRLQHSTRLQIPKLPFARIVKELLNSGVQQYRMQSDALEALQEATEMYVVQFLEDAYRCTLHRKQITLKPADMTLVRTLRGVHF